MIAELPIFSNIKLKIVIVRMNIRDVIDKFRNAQIIISEEMYKTYDKPTTTMSIV